MNRYVAFFLAIVLFPPAFAQEKPEISGYISGMPSIITQQSANEVWWQGLAHNRLNFGWQWAEAWRVDISVRNRLMFGSEALLSPEGTDRDAGWVDWSWNWAQGKQVLGNTAFDRLYITFEKNEWKLQLGRQRINWGQNFVWNPNDIFNTYSFFDFDYVERSGCDAFRATYYHNETSSTEWAAAVDREGKTTAALLHHWNRKRFDYQLIAGEQAESDWVLGGAWSGDFGGLNFRGEFSYFHPIRPMKDTAGTVAVSVGADYIFRNSLMLQAEVLYNNVGKTFSDGGLMGLYSAPLSAKYLSVCDWTLFGQASRPLTARLNASLSGMYFVDIRSCYAGVSLDFSLANNLDLSGIVQYFSALSGSELGDMQALLGFLRLKYSF
ncbi:MAG: hypothetical protein LBS46_01015 [Dysgonamonadaceae bacterium]|jgi:hypothetical protein|nr:hypothetical protein [Dysgonamonadaceae bacterium]